MSDIKISQMNYRALAADDQIPAINSAVPNDNNYFFGQDIPVLVGISKWDVAAVYAAGHLVIYNGTIVKGIFLITSTTSAGDSPEGLGYAKYRSIALTFVKNTFTEIGSSATIGYARTGRIALGVKSASGTSTLFQTDINSSLGASILDAKINLTLNRVGTGTSAVYTLRGVATDTGAFTITVEVFGTINLSGLLLDFSIEV